MTEDQWKIYDKGFRNFLIDEFGYFSLSEIRIVLEHRYLSKFMDVDSYRIISIGIKAKDDYIKNLEIEVKAMRKYLGDNWNEIMILQNEK